MGFLSLLRDGDYSERGDREEGGFRRDALEAAAEGGPGVDKQARPTDEDTDDRHVRHYGVVLLDGVGGFSFIVSVFLKINPDFDTLRIGILCSPTM